MEDILEAYIDQTIKEYEYLSEVNKQEGKKAEQELMLRKFTEIIEKKEYKYYCIHDYNNPYKAGLIGAAGGGGAAAAYNATMGHFTLYGSNEKPFTKDMLSLGRASFAGNPWKKEMKAKTLKSLSTVYIVRKSDIPSSLQKYVI